MYSFRRVLSVLISFICCVALQGYKPVGTAHKKHKSLSERKKVFNGVGCQHTQDLHVQYHGFNKLKPQQSEYYLADEVRLGEYARRYGKAVAQKQYAPMYLKWISDVVGYGIYATKDIKTGDFIGEYTGVLRPVKDGSDNLDYAWYYTIDGFDNQKLVIDGKKVGNELRFINHASDPNTMRVDVLGHDGNFHVCYVATRDIPKDHQLTVSYGEGYWTSRGVDPEAF